MFANRFLTYLNLLVGFVFLAVLITVYWFVYRVLPKTSGEVNLPVSAEVRVTRDSLGVPHIEAASVEDALFAQGYVTAQDRLWQMDATRRLASGTLSEVIGPSTIELDRESRRIRMRRIAEENERHLAAGERAHLAAFAAGVNAFVDSHRNGLPIEFTVLQYDPKPWTVNDCVLAGLQMYRTLTTSWKQDLAKEAMLTSGDSKLVNALYPSRAGLEFQPGSNAWALSGKLTASGKPILASDPHLDWNLPSTWYMVHLKAPGLNVSGVALPGLPGVIIGHNDRIAWGMTSLQVDVQDFYVEKLDLRSGQYVFQGKVEQARAEQDTIPVKGQKSETQVNWITRHGPVWTTEGGRVLALRWVAAEPHSFTFPFLAINTANNWPQFRAALSRFPGPGQNFIYADVDGNIGYQVGGRLPIRKDFYGDVPLEGSAGEQEWGGIIPFEDLPTSSNPAGGVILSSNQNPFPEYYPYRIHGNFDPGFRAQQIRARLLTKRGWQANEMLSIQKDVYSGLSHFIAKQVVQAYDERHANNPELKDAIDTLRNWNGQMDKEEAAPYLCTLLFQHLRRAFAERAAPGKGVAYDLMMGAPMMERAITSRDPQWFPDYGSLLLRTLLDAVEEGRRMQGKKAARWKQGEYLRLTIRHPVLSQIPWIGSYFNIGPVPMSGSSTTVKQTGLRLGPSMRFVADLSDWDRSLMNITIGESGQALSWHYKDQWDAYYEGRSFPMHFGQVDGSVLRMVPVRLRQ